MVITIRDEQITQIDTTEKKRFSANSKSLAQNHWLKIIGSKSLAQNHRITKAL